jgi:enoyl-CoA hydratase/carnithine racemase
MVVVAAATGASYGAGVELALFSDY